MKFEEVLDRKVLLHTSFGRRELFYIELLTHVQFPPLGY